MPTMSDAAGAQHALEAPRRSRHHGGEAIVTRLEPMRWGRVRGVGAVQAAGASMMDRACDALNGLSAERQMTADHSWRETTPHQAKQNPHSCDYLSEANTRRFFKPKPLVFFLDATGEAQRSVCVGHFVELYI